MKHLEGDGPYPDRHPNLVSKKTLERHRPKLPAEPFLPASLELTRETQGFLHESRNVSRRGEKDNPPL